VDSSRKRLLEFASEGQDWYTGSARKKRCVQVDNSKHGPIEKKVSSR